MKNRFALVAALLIPALALALLAGCAALYGGRRAPEIPDGYTGKSEHMQKDAWQDSADYCKYVYEDASAFETDAAYIALRAPDEKTDEPAAMRALFESFKAFMEAGDRLSEYDFDPACVSAGDLYRYKKTTSQNLPANPLGGPSIDGYSLWFFDKESATLYYIHANT